tara:strand:- start:469 stop:1797 length:1329 start_codon:yes stop_codon:yes gene_type:complete
MAQNYILLETIELTQSAASVTFDLAGISGYTDLKVVYSTRTTAASTSGNDIISINGSGASFTGRRIYGSGSAAASDTVTTWAGFNSANNGTASTFGNTEVYFPNAFGSTYKSYSIDTVQEQNGTTAYSALSAGLWSIIDAITSITLTPDSGNYAQHSTFSLYGVAALGTTPVTGPKAFGGNIVANDGTYWIHTFLTSGTFTPATELSCDYLVVAGGGGGGGDIAGGGGAGGYKAANSFAISSSLTVTVGAGGAGQTTYPSIGRGANGSNSVLSSITSTGGGGGSQGGATGKPGGSGGSGGGSGGTNGGSPLNPIGTASPAGQGSDGGQGNNGGSGSGRGGGGGGASATGASGTTSGAGGAGTSNSISGSAVTYAGGGGSGSYETTAGAGGAGGGGAGGRYAPPTVGGAGTTNTGGGGGGGSAGSAYGGNGASGIVIIRYAMA